MNRSRRASTIVWRTASRVDTSSARCSSCEWPKSVFPGAKVEPLALGQNAEHESGIPTATQRAMDRYVPVEGVDVGAECRDNPLGDVGTAVRLHVDPCEVTRHLSA
jgi:hypothetical protein